MRRIVIIESPYFNVPDACRYLACCALHCYQDGDIPWASHAIGPLALPEHVIMNRGDGKTGREIGISSGEGIKEILDSTKLYGARVPWFIGFFADLGFSGGMSDALVEAKRRRYPHASHINLEGEAKYIWEDGRWPSIARLTPNHEVTK